jgi:hypothetical protein
MYVNLTFGWKLYKIFREQQYIINRKLKLYRGRDSAYERDAENVYDFF